jgi:uncharacterized protein YecT (DUF1311 family)
MKIIILIAILGCFLSITVESQEIFHQQCSELATQKEIDCCVVNNYKIVERMLDSIYNAILFDLSYIHEEGVIDRSEPAPNIKNAIIKSQRSWVKYRNDVSEVIGKLLEGGSIANAWIWTYKTKLSLDRIRELKFLQKFNYGKVSIEPDWKIDK